MSGSSWVILGAALVWVACGSSEPGSSEDSERADARAETDNAPGDTDPAGQARWETPLSGLAGALLGVWGIDRSEIWAVGVDAGDGTGPIVVRGESGGRWERIDVRAADVQGGHLWWIFGPTDQYVWMVGEGGRILRYERASGGITRVESNTDAALYGIWGTSDDALWAVGGYVAPHEGAPTIIRLTAAGAEVVALPDGLEASGTFFKVWGTAGDDVWVVGERGMVVHFDGERWERTRVEDQPRLVTVHGGGGDLVAVGGTSRGQVFEGRSFAPVAFEDPVSPLNGVFVEADGAAWAVGMLGQVLRRADAAGGWERTATPVMRDWHAAWADGAGDLWVAGGDLLTRLDGGTLARYGPPRDDLPDGPLIELEPIVEEIAEPEPEIIEPEPEPEVVEPEPEVAEPEPEVVEPEDVADEILETEVTDVAEETDAGPSVSFAIGWIDYADDVFHALIDGDQLGIVHGPQGGIHLELAIRFPCDTEDVSVSTEIGLTAVINDQEVASYLAQVYPVPVVEPGICRSFAVPVIFEHPDAYIYAGLDAEIRASVSTDQDAWEHSVVVGLYDTL